MLKDVVRTMGTDGSRTKGIFRKVALDRLASPEQLDEVMSVTTTHSWVALVSIFGLLFVAIVWGFVGVIPTKIEADGLLIKSGGLADVAAPAAGQVTAVYVERGAHVDAGAVVARIAQPQLEEQVSAAQAALAELQLSYRRFGEFGEENLELRAAEINQRRVGIRAQMRSLSERGQWLEKRLEPQMRLLEQGLITNQAMQATTLELRTVQRSIDELQSELAGLKVEALSSKQRTDSERRAHELAITEGERKLSFLEEKLNNDGQVISTFGGRVLEIRGAPGDMVSPGVPLLSMEVEGGEDQPLQAIIFLHSSKGKRIMDGMKVHVEPSVVRKEVDGFLLAEVISVADFPSTRHGLMRVLDNEELVQSFLTKTEGAPLAIRVALEQDPNTPSGYVWSSGAGPDLRLTTGTPCRAAITVDTQRPISLVLPFLRFL